MSDAMYLALTCGVFLLILAVCAAVADAVGEPERWDSRRRSK